MCFRTQADIEAAKVAAFWEKRWREGYRWNPANEFNGFDHPQLLVATTEEPNSIQPMHWGLVPAWVKDEAQAKEMANRTLNAVGETVLEKPSFRSIIKKRCIIYVTGFYEWQHIDKKKIKYLIKVKDMESFALGGLYETWVNKQTGEPYTGFSIITCPANTIMAEIHNEKKRMPLIFDKESAAEWLVPLSKEEIQQRIVQFPAERMYAQAV